MYFRKLTIIFDDNNIEFTFLNNKLFKFRMLIIARSFFLYRDYFFLSRCVFKL